MTDIVLTRTLSLNSINQILHRCSSAMQTTEVVCFFVVAFCFFLFCFLFFCCCRFFFVFFFVTMRYVELDIPVKEARHVIHVFFFKPYGQCVN